MNPLTLTHGAHNTREDGMCLMEAVAFIAGEKHSDRPECACPVLSAFGRNLNDRMGRGAEGDALRAKYLAPLAEKIAGTRSTPEVEQKRAYLIADRAVRLFTSSALESAGLGGDAERLLCLPEIVDKQTARESLAAVADVVGVAAEAAWDAAYAATTYADAVDDEVASEAVEAVSYAAAWAVANVSAWEQAARVLVEACEITEAA
jgi:hypothetical protein